MHIFFSAWWGFVGHYKQTPQTGHSPLLPSIIYRYSTSAREAQTHSFILRIYIAPLFKELTQKRSQSSHDSGKKTRTDIIIASIHLKPCSKRGVNHAIPLPPQ